MLLAGLLHLGPTEHLNRVTIMTATIFSAHRGLQVFGMRSLSISGKHWLFPDWIVRARTIPCDENGRHESQVFHVELSPPENGRYARNIDSL